VKAVAAQAAAAARLEIAYSHTRSTRASLVADA
jgi:hypothetical protein